MPIRITGLNSGLDTEAIISALVSSYSYKTDKYKKAQTKLSWKQDAWKSLNTKIYSLYKSVGNLRLSSAYNIKSATVSDTTKMTIKASSSSVNGSYSVQITNLAKAVAFLNNRNYIVPDDVKQIFIPAANHRVILSTKAKMAKCTSASILLDILNSIRMVQQ